jgi:hypothetical protein
MSDEEKEIETLRAKLLRQLERYPTLNAFYRSAIEDTNTNLILLKST